MAEPIIEYIGTILGQAKEEDLKQLQRIRDYANGKQQQQITDHQLEIIGKQDDESFNPILNICPLIIRTHKNRIEMVGREPTKPDAMDAGTFETIKKTLADTWELEDLGRVVSSQVKAGIRDGNSYLILEYDKTEETPTFHFNPAFDGESGVYVYHTDKNNPKSALFAFKMWKEIDFIVGKGKEITRLNIYWEDRIEYFYQGLEENWQPYLWGKALAKSQNLTASAVTAIDDPGPVMVEITNPFDPTNKFQAAVKYWTTNGEAPSADNAPLGLPVVHYAHANDGTAKGTSDIKDIVLGGVQDSINMAYAHEIVAGAIESTRILYATNYDPKKSMSRTEEHDEPKIEIEAGSMIYNTGDGTFGAISGSDIRPLIQGVDSKIQKAASMTSTPLHFFNLRGQLPAEGTQSGLNEALKEKVGQTQDDLTRVYQIALRMLAKLAFAFGGAVTLTPELAKTIDKMKIEITWKPAQEQTEVQKYEIAEKQKGLGVSFGSYMKYVGWDDEKIELEIKKATSKRSEIIGIVSNVVNQADDQTPPNGATGETQPTNQRQPAAIGA